MNTSFDDFYRNKNLSEFLDDDLILQFKDNNVQLQELYKIIVISLLQNPEIVQQMLAFMEVDEFETDHKRIIKYPFMVSEILNSLYVLNDQHIHYTLELLNSTTLPTITIGYIGKILMNVLKHEPCKVVIKVKQFWQFVSQKQIEAILQEIDSQSDLVYSMIIFQTQENQLECFDQRTALVDSLIDRIPNSEGVILIMNMLLQQITDTLQEQKVQIIKHIFSRTADLLKSFITNAQVTQVLTSMIKYEQYYETEINAIYDYFLSVQQQIREALLQQDDRFGLSNLAYVQFYDSITNSQYIINHINGQELVDLMFKLLQKYHYNNQLHKYASNVMMKFLPSIDNQKLIESLIVEINMKKANRGYLLKIINKLYELNESIQRDNQVDQLNQINNSYLLGVIPDQKPTFNLQEEFEVAMNKLQI